MRAVLHALLSKLSRAVSRHDDDVLKSCTVFSKLLITLFLNKLSEERTVILLADLKKISHVFTITLVMLTFNIEWPAFVFRIKRTSTLNTQLLQFVFFSLHHVQVYTRPFIYLYFHISLTSAIFLDLKAFSIEVKLILLTVYRRKDTPCLHKALYCTLIE